MSNSQQISIVSSVVTDKTEVFFFQPSSFGGCSAPKAGVYRARLLLDKKAIEDDSTWTPLKYMKTSSRTHPQPDALPFNIIMSFDKSATSQVSKVLCNKCRKHKQRVSSPLSVRLLTKKISNDYVVELGHIHLCGSFMFYSMQGAPIVRATNVSFCSYSHASQHYCSVSGVDLMNEMNAHVERELGRVEIIGEDTLSDDSPQLPSPETSRRLADRHPTSVQLPQVECLASHPTESLAASGYREQYHPPPSMASRRPFMSLTCDDDSPISNHTSFPTSPTRAAAATPHLTTPYKQTEMHPISTPSTTHSITGFTPGVDHHELTCLFHTPDTTKHDEVNSSTPIIPWAAPWMPGSGNSGKRPLSLNSSSEENSPRHFCSSFSFSGMSPGEAPDSSHGCLMELSPACLASAATAGTTSPLNIGLAGWCKTEEEDDGFYASRFPFVTAQSNFYHRKSLLDDDGVLPNHTTFPSFSPVAAAAQPGPTSVATALKCEAVDKQR